MEEKIKKKNPATPVAGFSIVLPIWFVFLFDVEYNCKYLPDKSYWDELTFIDSSKDWAQYENIFRTSPMSTNHKITIADVLNNVFHVPLLLYIFKNKIKIFLHESHKVFYTSSDI